eukprot:384250_1
MSDYRWLKSPSFLYRLSVIITSCIIFICVIYINMFKINYNINQSITKITLLTNETILKTENKSANISAKSNKFVTIRPICSNPGMRKGRIHIAKDKLRWTPYYSKRWGNVLSPMWQARAMAILGGYIYTSRIFGSRTWMEYLPHKYYNISGVNITQFHIACNSCHGKRWEFAHECFNAWDFIHE